MAYQTLIVRTDHRKVCEIRLNRPDKRNALSAEMIDELTKVAIAVGADPEIRAVVLSAEGMTFCAGGDLNWMREQIASDRTGRVAAATRLARMLSALNTMPKALIGRIDGDAYGGGVGLACICDVAVASDTARFGLTETRLGLIPATIGPYVVARMGEGNARRVFMSARRIEADEARSLGIVARVVAPADMDAAIASEIDPYLSAAPGAVGRAKALVRFLGPRIDEDVIAATAEHLADAWEQQEASQGIEAFLAKKRPIWQAGQ